MANFIPAPDRLAYERQPKESSLAFARFCIYRDAGMERSYRGTAEKAGVTYATIASTAGKWSWDFRASEWDRIKDAQARRSELADTGKMRSNHITLAKNLWGLAANELNRHMRILKQRDESLPPVMNFKTITDMIRIGTSLERLSRGEPDTVNEHRIAANKEEARDSMRALLSDPDALEALDKVLLTIDEPNK